MNNMSIPTKKQLSDSYALGYSMREIANYLNMSVGKIHKYFRLYNIIPRPRSNEISKKKISKAQRGNRYALGNKLTEEHKQRISLANQIKGIGHKKKRKDGYVAIFFPSHPKSNKNGYIMEHDLIMECNIGRWLKEDEVVHHKNKIRDDNRIENLELMTFKEHARLHMIERHKKERGDDLSIV